jgi:hypothetical protein
MIDQIVEMDLNNSEVGWNLQLENPNVSTDILSVRILEKLNNGSLKIILPRGQINEIISTSKIQNSFLGCN